MTDVLVGDALLELAKAKELASVMGGAWHSKEEDVDLDSDSELPSSSQRNVEVPSTPVKPSSSIKSGPDGLFVNLISSPIRERLYSLARKGSGMSNYSSHGGGDSKHSTTSNHRNHSIHGGGGDALDRSSSGNNTTTTRRTSDGPAAAANGFSRGSRRGRGAVRRPADGRAPGRRDPAAVARLEAAARRAAAEGELPEGMDPSWRLPTDVDYYTDRAALLRELVKEMPADKRLSFQTRVANARTKEAVESVLEDYAERLECLALPHARSGEIDLQQVKKDTARERVFLDGEEMAFWGSPSDKPNSWHEELWATVEARVRDGLLRGNAPGSDGSKSSDKNDFAGEGKGSRGVGGGGGEVDETPAVVVVDKARALASEEWNKARAVATTSEVFKAMSRTGAGGDAYFALVALFCTADKLVVPVHCQESPITVEFLSGSSADSGSKGQQSRSSVASWKTSGARAAGGGGGGGRGGRGAEDVHVVVTVPSTFDIYLRDGRAAVGDKGGSGSGGGGGKTAARNGGGAGGSGVYRKGGGNAGGGSGGGGHGGADASIAVHLVRVKAVVEEEIWVVGSSRVPASSSSLLSSGAGKGGRKNGSLGGAGSAGAGYGGGGGGPKKSIDDDAPPTLRFLMETPMDRASYGGSGSKSSSSGNIGGGGRSLDSRRSSSDSATAHRAGGGGSRRGGGESPAGTPPPPPPAPLLTLTRTERRMRVSMVPEPSVVSEMVRNISRKMGVDMPGPQPPRVLGC